MFLISMVITAWKVPRDESKGERPHNDYPGIIVLSCSVSAWAQLFLRSRHGRSRPSTGSLSLVSGIVFMCQLRAPL